MEQASLNFDSRPASIPRLGLGNGALVVFVVLVAPFAAHAVNLAGHLRLIYPAANFLLAIYFYTRRSPWYAAQCLLLFCFAPLVRRLVDEQAGFDASNPVLLTPYLCCVLTVPGVLSAWWEKPSRYLAPVLALLLCIAYGTTLAMIEGRLFASILDAVKWSIGPLFAAYVFSQRERYPETRRVVETCVIWAGVAAGVYGIAQFIRPASWDVQWVQGVAQLGMTSLGNPDPFSLRVFSTMNSPGSFAMLVSAGIVLALKQRIPLAAPSIAVMAAGLALSQYRTVWAATLLAILMVLVSRPRNVSFAKVLTLLGLAALLGAGAAIPQISESVSHRAASVTDLRSDESFNSRLDQYRALVSSDENLIVGEGLAISGASRRLDQQQRIVIDSGVIEIARAFGVLAGTAFLLAMALLVAPLFGRAARSHEDVWFDRAIVVATFVQLPMGSVHIGELGFFAWLFLGLGLAALEADPTPAAYLEGAR
ncbi:MAG: hypothetical protein WDO68_17450 [Gammaproteobacteria bacterium]